MSRADDAVGRSLWLEGVKTIIPVGSIPPGNLEGQTSVGQVTCEPRRPIRHPMPVEASSQMDHFRKVDSSGEPFYTLQVNYPTQHTHAMSSFFGGSGAAAAGPVGERIGCVSCPAAHARYEPAQGADEAANPARGALCIPRPNLRYDRPWRAVKLRSVDHPCPVDRMTG